MDLGLGKDKQEALGEEAGKEIKGVAKSAWNGFDAAATQFSEECNEGINWAGENILGLKFDRPDEHGVTYRQIAEKDKQRAIDHVNKLEVDAPYKDIFNATKNTVNKGLNIAGLAMAARDLPALAKAGFAKIKDLNMALKSLGIDTKFIDQGLEVVENCSKKVTGKLSKEAEDFREAIKKFFGETKGSKAVESAKDILSNINKVEYGVTDLGKMAIEYRKANNITSAGRNVAVFKYVDNNGEINHLTTVSNKFDHAEEVALNYFKENGISGENIKSIYSEREPCISTPTNGTKNCTGKINEYCPDAEVTYTVDYGDTPESGRNARNELKNLIDESMK